MAAFQPSSCMDFLCSWRPPYAARGTQKKKLRNEKKSRQGNPVLAAVGIYPTWLQLVPIAGIPCQSKPRPPSTKSAPAPCVAQRFLPGAHPAAIAGIPRETKLIIQRLRHYVVASFCGHTICLIRFCVKKNTRGALNDARRVFFAFMGRFISGCIYPTSAPKVWENVWEKQKQQFLYA